MIWFVHIINPIQDGPFRGCSRMDGALPKICNTYPIMMKLDNYTIPRVDPKNMQITLHTP